MVRRSERAELVAAVSELYLIGQALYHRYQNDVSPRRAEDMERLFLELEPIAQPIIDRYPFGYGNGRTIAQIKEGSRA